MLIVVSIFIGLVCCYHYSAIIIPLERMLSACCFPSCYFSFCLFSSVGIGIST